MASDDKNVEALGEVVETARGIIAGYRTDNTDLRAQLAAALARAESAEAELLRVRTTGHGAAHELDNIAIECGLGHSPKPGVVAAHVRAMKDRAEKAEKERDELRGVVVTVDTPNEVCDGTYAATLGTIIDAYGTEALGWLTNQECDWKQRAEKAEALYAKAWAECRRWRNYYGSFHAAVLPTYGWWTKDGQYDMPTADAHDAARKEAGLC